MAMDNLRFERSLRVNVIREGNVNFQFNIFSTNAFFPHLRESSNHRLVFQRVHIVEHVIREHLIRNMENKNPNEIPLSYAILLTGSFPIHIGPVRQVNQRLPADAPQRLPVRQHQHQSRKRNPHSNCSHERSSLARIRERQTSALMRES
ncbi:hypothetical protein T4E_6187 [Trichinella pseudospiralis]|uniref:Uncharacterized protein n=1 Tax=Trichinella pseudospiralis TaxID=6337 RepID=A0A0V0YJ70_TRIPS|nr:hypothetical protein T4E_6187 [Trichinella pseudospiralis]